MGNGGTGGMGYRGMSNRVLGVWGQSPMGYKGYGSHGQWDTWGMGHMGTGGMGYKEYGPCGQWGPWATCSQNIKKMSSCQKYVKLSKRCQMSKNETPRLWRRFTKKLNWHNEVYRYWHQFWCNKWWSLKTLKMFIESIFGQFWWPSYLTSKLTSICVNLIKSIYFFCELDFLTTWHLLTFLHI